MVGGGRRTATCALFHYAFANATARLLARDVDLAVALGVVVTAGISAVIHR